MESRQYIFSKTAVFLIVFVIIISLGFDYFLNLKTSHTLYENLLLILSCLAVMLFTLMSCGLYFGVKLKDNIGKISNHIDMKKLPDFSGGAPDISMAIGELGSFAEGLGGFIFAVIAACVLIMIGWALVLVSWFLIIFLAAILYWIFFRAIRLVFKYSMQCKGNLTLSLKYSFFYTFVYLSWIYGIVVALHYVKI